MYIYECVNMMRTSKLVLTKLQPSLYKLKYLHVVENICR